MLRGSSSGEDPALEGSNSRRRIQLLEEDWALRGSSFQRIQFLEDPAVRESNSQSARLLEEDPVLSPLMLSQPPVWDDPRAGAQRATHGAWTRSRPLLRGQKRPGPLFWWLGPGAPGRAMLLPGRLARIWLLPPMPSPGSTWLGSGAAGSTGSTRMRRARALVATPHPAGTSGSIHGASWDFPLGIPAELCGASPCIPPVLPQLLFFLSFPVFLQFFSHFLLFYERPVKGWVDFVTNTRSCHWHGPPNHPPPPPNRLETRQENPNFLPYCLGQKKSKLFELALEAPPAPDPAI